MANEKLTELAADGRKHLEQSVVSRANPLAEELHDAEEFTPVANGDSEASVQSFLRGDGCAGKVCILDHVDDPGGLTASPDTPGQSNAACKSALPGGQLELFRFRGWHPPDVN